MILIRTDWASFEEYLASLSKPARKNYKAVMKQYAHLDYGHWSNGEFPTAEVGRFMSLWERQLIRGERRQWAFPVEMVEGWARDGNIALFKAYNSDYGDAAMHFIQKRDGYWECHPPMYDKTRHPSLAKWMWFKLIKFAIEHKFEPLDFGGGSDDWVYHIKHRAEYPNPTYKWIYVPEKTKKNPDLEPHYHIERPPCKLLLKD